MDLLATKLQKASPRIEDNLAAPNLTAMTKTSGVNMEVKLDQEPHGSHSASECCRGPSRR